MLLDSTNLNTNKLNIKTINRTIKTSKLIDAFWERWLVHGVELEDLNSIRSELESLEKWLSSWENLAQTKEKQSKELTNQGLIQEAEYLYRQTALYYNINYWIEPKASIEKRFWYEKCLEFVNKADNLSNIETLYRTITLDDNSQCSGRIRIPIKPRGCILIINPIDSCKEELFTYEMDFVNNGFITLSFDGPGQGETFIKNEVIGTRQRWEEFIFKTIDFASELFEGLPIYLFGTSLGASWVLFGSSHQKVSKSVAVSPAVELEKMNMPTYFMDRMRFSCIVEEIEKRAIPKFNEINFCSPIMVFHGNKDMMVPNKVMYDLFRGISSKKEIIEFSDEGHVCNNKLNEIRRQSILWFSEKK